MAFVEQEGLQSGSISVLQYSSSGGGSGGGSGWARLPGIDLPANQSLLLMDLQVTLTGSLLLAAARKAVEGCAEDDDDSNETNDSCTSSHHVLVHSLPLAAPAWQLVGGGDATSAAVPLATAPTALQLGLDAAGQPLLLLAREGGAAVVLERSGGGWAQLGGRATSQHDTVDAAMAVVDGAPLVVFGDAENEQREGNRLSARRWGPASSSRGGGGGGGSSANKWAAVGEDYWSLAQLETNRLTPALAAGPDSPAYVAFSFYQATYQQVAAMQWDAAAGTWVDAGEPFGMGTCWGVRLALRPESGLPVAAFLSTPSSRNPPLAAVYVYSPPGRWAALGAPQGFRPATALDLSVDPSTGALYLALASQGSVEVLWSVLSE